MPVRVPVDSATLDLASRIIALNDEVNRHVSAANYLLAANLRDEREALERELKRVGNPTLLRNVQLAIRHPTPSGGIWEQLEPNPKVVDEFLLQLLASQPVPVRWVITGLDSPLIGTLRKVLDVERLDSNYFRARFPSVSWNTLGQVRDIQSWVRAIEFETGRSPVPVVWVCGAIEWLEKTGLIERLLNRFRDPSTEFVIWTGKPVSATIRQFLDLPSCVEIGQQQSDALLRLLGEQYR